VHLSIYSPPFGGLYHYSNERDLSNCDDYDAFFEHYAFVVRELARHHDAGPDVPPCIAWRCRAATAGPTR
jgi:hypothetical protein